ncbi:MAG: phosphoribosylformylglycinamidine synthase subunit PurQ [Treponema sp.]|nr:phosphoribosylformylglycinamidine synthase subunit PurQ [Treponema sp.]
MPKNGSAFAIEGLTSPDGLVLGKMGHSERTVGIGGYTEDLIKNIARYEEASSCQNLFRAGVRYFNS